MNIDDIIHEALLDVFYDEKISEYEILWIGYFLKKQR